MPGPRYCLLLLVAACTGIGPGTAPADRTCIHDGIRLHYLDAGAGELPVVLVHGFGGSAAVWRHNLRDLAAFARVLAVDLPGHGGSEAPEEPQAYRADRMADALAAVLDDAGCDKAVLVGHSNGGAIVRRFQRRHPQRCAGLVFVEAPLKGFLTLEQAERMAAPLLGPGGEQVAALLVDGVVASVPPAYRDEIRAVALATPRHVLHATLLAGNAPELWTDDPIPVPVLALYARSPFWDEAYEAHVRALCPDLDYRVWEGVGHFLMLDRPARFQAALRDFWARIARG